MISKWQNRWEWNTDPPSKPTNQHRIIPPSLMHSFFVPPLPLDIFFKNPRVSLDSLDQEGIQGESYFVYIRGFWTLSLPRNSCLLWYTVHTHTHIYAYTHEMIHPRSALSWQEYFVVSLEDVETVVVAVSTVHISSSSSSSFFPFFLSFFLSFFSSLLFSSFIFHVSQRLTPPWNVYPARFPPCHRSTTVS